MNKQIIILIALAAIASSIPAGAEINATPGGGGTYPPEWIVTPTPAETPTVVPVPEEPAAPAVDIRGEVVDAATQIAPFTWTGQNFAGLYYDVERNLMSDSLTSTVTVPNAIESGDLAYTTYRVESNYKNKEIGEYFAIGWFGERYMAINGKPYLISPIIFEMNERDTKTLATGDRWNVGNGYSLVVMQIDLDANKVWLSLVKDGTEVASSIIAPHETGDWFGNHITISGFPGAYTVTMRDEPTTSTFVYQEDVGLEADVPIFSVYVGAIFRGTKSNLVQLKYAMTIDDDLVSVIETGAGMMESETVTPESVRLVNRRNINLRTDSDTMIAEGLWIHVADDRDGDKVSNYRYYPYVRCGCPAPAPYPGPTPAPPPKPTPPPADGYDEIRIRGEVVEPASWQTEDIVWNASNFAAFRYDPDDDLMTETLTIAAGALSMYDRTVGEREIGFDCSEWGKYNVTSFMAETYFTGYSANTSDSITDETISLISRNMLCKVLIDEDCEHTIPIGTSLELHEGYELKIIQLDTDGGQAQLELLKNGKSVDTDIVRSPDTYVYTKDLGKLDDVPIIAIRIGNVFSGTETDMIVVEGIFQISEDYICDRTIGEREIEYVTETRGVDFDYSGWGEYNVIGFMAETYFAGYNTETEEITDETISLVSNGVLCKVLIDEDDKHTVSTGASLELEDGYELKIIQLDTDGNQAQIELLKNGKSVDTDIVRSPDNYIYKKDLGKLDDVPLIAIRVDSVFSGTEIDVIVIRGIFQISEDYTSVNPGNIYGEMKIVNTSSDTIRMVNYDDITLSEGDTIHLMGDIRLIVADNETLRFAPIAELTEPGTYEVRGAVRRQGGNQSAAIVWNASNFAAFWYDIDSDVSTETLEIAPGTLLGLNRTIGEGNLSYTTHPVYREYELHEEGLTVEGHEGYLTEGWVGRQCVVINGRADKLCELLIEFEGDDKKTLSTGEAWDIGSGFALTARQIDLDGTKVWFSLYKNGKELDSEVTPSDEVYTYTADIGGEDDVPVFSCYVDAIFRGTDSNVVLVMYVFLIDDDVLEIDTGDGFGCMEVVAAGSDGVVLENNETIDLGAGTTEQIMEDMYFKTADDSDLRFYPFVERTISGDELTPPAEPEPTPTPAEPEPATNVTMRVNECIVLNNDIHIDLLDVDSDMGWYARVRFCSYRDSVGKRETLYQGDCPSRYTSGTGMTIEVILDSAFPNGASFVIESSKELMITERYNITDRYNVTISAADTDGDGVPDVWDMDNSTPAGYWINSEGIGRRWGDMNGDGKLTSADALMILQAAVGSIELTPTENVTMRPPKPIYLDDFAFTPKNPTIRMGEALNWINLQKSPMVDFVLVNEEGLWDNQTIRYGKKFKYTFNTSGSYTYYCPGYGGAMRGTVMVLE